MVDNPCVRSRICHRSEGVILLWTTYRSVWLVNVMRATHALVTRLEVLTDIEVV